MPSTPDLDLDALVGKEARDLLVTGLQALHRERCAARNTVLTAASLRGEASPSSDDKQFGVDEVVVLLRRLGAAPHHY